MIAAYQGTIFRVLAEETLDLIVGERCEPLRQLYELYGCASSAFITAYSPYSVAVSATENTIAQKKLEEELTRYSIRYIAGIGEDREGLWPGEPSVLALGLSLSEAKSWGTEFKQNAIVWTPGDLTPQLVLLR